MREKEAEKEMGGRIELLADPLSFVEFDALVEHRCTDFGMAKESYLGEKQRRGKPKD